MIKLVEKRPDITINEIIEELNLPIKKSRVSKILLEEKMYLKKSRLVFLGESGVNVNMTRFYGRAKGKKACI